jgi:hypothetical protein
MKKRTIEKIVMEFGWLVMLFALIVLFRFIFKYG